MIILKSFYTCEWNWIENNAFHVLPLQHVCVLFMSLSSVWCLQHISYSLGQVQQNACLGHSWGEQVLWVTADRITVCSVVHKQGQGEFLRFVKHWNETTWAQEHLPLKIILSVFIYLPHDGIWAVTRSAVVPNYSLPAANMTVDS